MTFDELDLSPWLLEAIQEKGYEHPTLIQAKTIPVALTGRDVLGIAQTGTGKTGAFCFPLLESLAKGRLRARMPRALILTPTRELAIQIEANIKEYSQRKPVSTALIVGGASMNDQATLLSRGVDVLVATPGRLLDHLERGRILTGDIRILVIDEADRMMDMGFIEDIEIIVKKLPPQRQTLLFSATMPEAIQTLAHSFQTDPVLVQVNATSPSAELVTQWRIEVPTRKKRAGLARVLEKENFDSLIIFCNRKREIASLAKYLEEHVRKPIKVGIFHGDLSQETRINVVQKFKDGLVNVMVASDVAARGLDIAGMSHVINFDIPTHADEYIHRIGRTGRAGRSGVAITFVTESDHKALKAIMDLVKKDIDLYPSLENEEKIEKKRVRHRAPLTPEPDNTQEPPPTQETGFGHFSVPGFMR